MLRHTSIWINIVFSVSINFNWRDVCSVATGNSGQHAGVKNAKQYWDKYILHHPVSKRIKKQSWLAIMYIRFCHWNTLSIFLAENLNT